MRIGLFGGTFNPIHFGHLRAALEVKEGFGLEKIHLIQSAIPPHKERGGIVDADDRLDMTRLAVSNDPDLTVSDIEVKRSGLSYTIDTVNHFKSILPEDHTLYFIMGIDAFLEIETWKSYMDLFLLVKFIVVDRAGIPGGLRKSPREIIEHYLKTRVSADYFFSSSKSCFIHDQKERVFVFNVSTLDISSTKIRKLIRSGKSINFLVPHKVNEYIKTKGLFL